jgi:lipoprotein-anchoring transpeptidase ErfK/SrfK
MKRIGGHIAAFALMLAIGAGSAFGELSGDAPEPVIKKPVEEAAAPVVEAAPPAAELVGAAPLVQDVVAPKIEPLVKARKTVAAGNIKKLSPEEKKKLAALKAEEEHKKAEAALDAPKAPEIPFLFGLFDAKKPEPVVLSEEQSTFDGKALETLKKQPPKIETRFQKLKVAFSGYHPGTIVIDTRKRYLYFVESPVLATRYGVAVGKEGLLFTGKVEVGAKQPWPRWIPTKEMIERDPKHYAQYAEGMDGGPDNPLGARAIYLYLGKQDTKLRIHGTNQPNSIGSAASNGCFRMLNEHVIDLYDRVKIGAPVVVL